MMPTVDEHEINMENVSAGNVRYTFNESVPDKTERSTLAADNTAKVCAADPADNKVRRVLVVGAGAAGLMAAIVAAERGTKVTVLEHKSEPGIKLAITGNGRCNYTNTDVSADKYHCDDDTARSFVELVLRQFGFEDSISFFRALGIEPEIRHYSYDDSGYVYPKDMNARDFRDAMYQAAIKRGVVFRFGVSDDEVIETVLHKTAFTGRTENDTYTMTACSLQRDSVSVADVAQKARTIINSDNRDKSCSVEYDAVLIATGSNAYPMTGSDSSIYPLFKKLGIKQERFLPALCALYSKDVYLKTMKGRRVKTEARLSIYGDLSGQAADTDVSGNCREPDNGSKDTEAEQSIHIGTTESAKETADNSLALTTYSAAGEIQFNEHSISGIPVMQLSRYAAKALNEGKKTVLSIDGHDYVIHRTAGFDRAQTCTGGIRPAELDPHTMRHSSGLYFCGEIIDIDGECGGYNLQFAWSTGFLAGCAAAQAAVGVVT